MPLQLDTLLPSPYKILGFLAYEKNFAKWNGKEWFPNYDALDIGKSFQEILSEFQDFMFVSKSLDYLLESGLLRAKDLPVTGKNNCYSRAFLPAGEYNALRVSRVSNVLNYRLPLISTTLSLRRKPLNSGDLTDKAKLILEERTALFI